MGRASRRGRELGRAVGAAAVGADAAGADAAGADAARRWRSRTNSSTPIAATQTPSRIPNAPPEMCALTSTPSGVPTTAAAMSTAAMRRVSRPRSWPERAKAPVPSVALPTLVAIAVPLIAAGGSPENRNSPIVTSTPPGPSAVVPTPPAKPNSARRISVPAERWSALWVSPAAANAITRPPHRVARAPLASGHGVRRCPRGGLWEQMVVSGPKSPKTRAAQATANV